jgi:hypothetical protein
MDEKQLDLNLRLIQLQATRNLEDATKAFDPMLLAVGGMVAGAALFALLIATFRALGI